MGIKVVHCKKDKYDVYIGRSKDHLNFGNPFSIGQDGNREEVINKFREWFKTGNPFGNKLATQQNRSWIINNIHSLKNKTLACWCSPLACHGDVYGEILNEQSI